MAVVARGDVVVKATAPGFERQVQQAIGVPIEHANQAAGKKGGMLFSGIWGKTIKAAGLGATLATGLALKGGWDRALNIEDAKAKLSGLGHSTATVTSIMDNAMSAVKGTAFGMGDAASVAASAVAAGVKPGKDLERTLKLVGDAATIAGADMGEMGSIFNKVAASNKMQMDVVNQLQDRGVPILAMVAEQMGVTTEEAAKMASEGKVNFEIFQKAMEEGLGGAALKSGDTLRGTIKNVIAAFSRFGEKVITPLLPQLKNLGKHLMEVADALAEKVIPLVEKAIQFFSDWGPTILKVAGPMVAFVATFNSLNSMIGTIGRLSAATGNLFSIMRANPLVLVIAGIVALSVAFITAYNNSESFRNAVDGIAKKVTELWTAIGPVGQAIAKFGASVGISTIGFIKMIPAIKTTVSVIGGIGAKAVSAGQSLVLMGMYAKDGAVKVATGFASITKGAIKASASAVAATARITASWARAGVAATASAAKAAAAWVASSARTVAALATQTAAFVAQKAAILAHAAATGIVKAATAAWTGVQWLLNIALNANPIGLIVLALAAFVGAIYLAWTKCETFRNIVMAVWEGIKIAAVATLEWFTTYALPVLSAVWEGIKAALSTLWTFWSGVWGQIEGVVFAVWGVIKNYVSTAMTVISSVVSAVMAAFSGDWKGAWEHIKTAVLAVWNFMSSLIGTVWKGIQSVISAGLNLVWSLWSAAWNKVSGFISGAWNRISSGVASGIGNLISYFSGLPRRIVSALGNLGNLLWDAGKAVIKGFIEGVKSMWNSVKSTFSGLTDMLPSWKGPPIKDAQILKGAGRLVMQGFVDGLRSEFVTIEHTLNNLTGGIAAGSFTGIESISGAATGSGAVNNFYISMPETDPDALSMGIARRIQQAGV